MPVHVSDRQRSRGLARASAASRTLGPLVAVALILLGPALRPEPAAPEVHVQRVSPGVAGPLELANLPGAGLALARRVVLFRHLIAPLETPDRMRGVPGLGSRRLHRWSRWIATR